jgi:hypothetical protein
MCMYVCKGQVRICHLSSPCIATSKMYCFPSLFITLSVLNFWWSAGLSLWGHHGSHSVPWSNDPCGKILNKLLPHNHIGYVWLILLFLGTVCTLDCLPVTVQKGALLGDNAPWAVLPLSVAGVCPVLIVPHFVGRWFLMSLPIWVHLTYLIVSCGLCLSSTQQFSWQHLRMCHKLVQVLVRLTAI